MVLIIFFIQKYIHIYILYIIYLYIYNIILYSLEIHYLILEFNWTFPENIFQLFNKKLLFPLILLVIMMY